MTSPYRTLLASLCLLATISWTHGAKTPLDPTKTRIANPMDRAPVIDGQVEDPNTAGSEWAQSGFRGWEFRIDETAPGDGIRGADLGSGEKPTDDADLSVNVHAGLVGENLYIGVIVVDDDISTDSAEAGSENGSTWLDDSVEIFIDGDNSNFPDRDTTGTNPEVVDTGGQFVITANNAYRHTEAGNPPFDPSSGWFAQTQESDDGYHAEFLIPLRLIGNPQLGEHIGFSVAVNDDDGGGDAEGQLIWIGATHEEATYGNLVIGHRRYEGLKGAPPTIDGVIGDDEYASAEVVSITPFTGIYRVGDDASTPDNHRFDWRLSHDEESIYVAVRVWDDQIVADTAEPNSEDGQTWIDDSVEIFFDSNESNLPGRDQNEQYDGQFVYTTNGAWRDNEANNPTYGENADWWAQSTVAADGESWDVEFVVKKATLVGGFTEDEPIGFNVNINDDDTGERGFQLNWDGSPHNENTYGSLILVGCIPSEPGACPERRSLDYGLLDQSSARGTETLTIRNLGVTDTLTLSNAQIAGPAAAAYTIVGDFPSSIPPGGSASVDIAFDASGQTGAFDALLTYETNDPDPTESTLTAKLAASVLNLQGGIARWALDETEGEAMLDVSGWSRHGTYRNGPELDQDPLLDDDGRSVLFQGGTYGAVPGETFDSFVRFSVALHANLNDLGGFQTLFAKGTEGGSPTFALLNLDGTLQWFTNEAPEFGTEAPVLVAGQNHHIVATWDTARAAIYVDGALVAEQMDPEQVEILLENLFVLGSFFNNLNLDGRLDDVQFYNRALTSADAEWLFENPGCEIGQAGCGEKPPILINLAAGEAGLAGFYWNREPASTPTVNEPMHRRGDGPEGADNANSGWVDENVYSQEATGAFTASTFTYQGDDLTPIGEWLGADAGSFTGTAGNLGDGIFRMVGYLRMEQAGSRDFTMTSDDGSVLYINDSLVISNDNGHGNQTVTATVDFPQPGYYPVDVRYFNGDWTDDAGTHGGANFLGEAGFTDFVQSVDTVTPFWDHAVGDPPNQTLADEPGVLPADSMADFGGLDTDKGWQYGYRIVDPANATTDYDPFADMILFPDDWWNGTVWDEPNADGDNVPWTTIAAGSTHPNGDNNGEIHWTIRRWTSPGGPTDITWSIAKQNVDCGNGVTGAVHVNGAEVDSATINSDDGVGVTRTVSVDLQTGNVVDLIHSPLGIDGTHNDGCDGALMSMTIEEGTGVEPPPTDLDSGLLAYYPLDGNLQDGVGDSHGVGKTWRAGGKADQPELLADHPAADLTYADGAFGQGVDLDGAGQYIETPLENEESFDFGAPDNPTGFTVSAWFRVDGFTKGWQALIAKGEQNQWRVHRQGSTDNLVGNGGNADIGQNLDSVNDGQIHHVALVSDPANGNVRLYIDGVLREEGAAPALENNPMPMMIGQNPDTDDRTWDGLIDDVALWSRPLTEAEVGMIAGSEVSLGELAGVPSGGGGGERLFDLLDAGLNANGAFTVTIPDGLTSDIEYSTNLVDWEVIATGVTGLLEETDATRLAAPEGYYRAK